VGEVVNLRRARKARDRADRAAAAETSRALHGRTPAEKTRDRLEAERLSRTLDGAERERD